jgi:hypothetical protein
VKVVLSFLISLKFVSLLTSAFCNTWYSEYSRQFAAVCVIGNILSIWRMIMNDKFGRLWKSRRGMIYGLIQYYLEELRENTTIFNRIPD